MGVSQVDNNSGCIVSQVSTVSSWMENGQLALIWSIEVASL